MFRTDFNKNSNADSHGFLLFYHEILHHGCFKKSNWNGCMYHIHNICERVCS